MRTTYTGPVKDRGTTKSGKANVSREELESFREQYGADKTLRDLLNADRTGKTPASVGAGSGRGMAAGRTASDKDTTSAASAASAASAGPRRKPEADTSAMLERMKDRAARGELLASNEEERDRAKGRTLAALGAMPGVGAASKLVGAAPKVAGMASKAGEAVKGAASKAGEAVKSVPKAAPRVEPRVGRPVTTKLDDAAAAFSRPQARQASKDTGYTREPSKTTPPQPTRAPKPRDEIIKRQAQMREGRKATEDYARDVMERGAEMGMKRGGNVKSYAKGGSVRGAGCETRTKKARYV
jgi:hypothetical protein